ncbi:MAG TPA: RNA polymerase sigma factor [Terracidiphilus sp.]|nr:RNA polymerase sigma factor [Terracidiphilus sp.]
MRTSQPSHIVSLQHGSGQVLNTGEDADFTALVRRQSRFVFRVAYAVLLNSHDAEDAVQETFLKLYRNRGWQQAQNERAYLARVAWRVAVDLRPRNARLAEHVTVSHSELETPSPNPSPERTLLAANQHALIHALIDALPEELRVPLMLSAFDELNSREIGGILGIPEGTVRTRLRRARQMLCQKLSSFEETRYA